jgi:hypothetical protein
MVAPSLALVKVPMDVRPAELPESELSLDWLSPVCSGGFCKAEAHDDHCEGIWMEGVRGGEELPQAVSAPSSAITATAAGPTSRWWA